MACIGGILSSCLSIHATNNLHKQSFDALHFEFYWCKWQISWNRKIAGPSAAWPALSPSSFLLNKTVNWRRFLSSLSMSRGIAPSLAVMQLLLSLTCQQHLSSQLLYHQIIAARQHSLFSWPNSWPFTNPIAHLCFKCWLLTALIGLDGTVAFSPCRRHTS